jgi:hypothetical protein
MSLQIVFSVATAEFSIPVRDPEIFSRVTQNYPEEAEAVYGVQGPDEAIVDVPQAMVSYSELLAAVEKLVDAFKTDPGLSPRRYVFDFDIFPGVPAVGNSDVYGVKLPGDEQYYVLEGGVGQCVLQQNVFASHRFPPKEPLDLRDRQVLETESHGPIKIRSTKKRSAIATDLKRLAEFLRAHPGDCVIKRLV